ncbi:MAG: hypothetical protein Q9191_000320 [Dirinaria sp. TL-2023a]
MEELRTRHVRERRDLQSRITQKKKSATKKTRKGINDECAELERQLKERQDAEIAVISGERQSENGDEYDHLGSGVEFVQEEPANNLNGSGKSVPVSHSKAPNGQIKKPNRQKARLARRAAEQEAVTEQAAKEAEDLPNLRAKETEDMRQEFLKYGLKEQEIRSDGHCLYAAVADQLADNEIDVKPNNHIEGLNYDSLASQATYKGTREVAASYIAANAEDFAPFLEEPLDQYVQTIRDTGEWGGHVELLALARAYGRNINVLHSSGNIDTIDCGSETQTHPFWLSYYKHNFGLGEHYNSLHRSP